MYVELEHRFRHTSIPFIKVLPPTSVNAGGSFRAFRVSRRPTAMSSGVEFSYRPSWGGGVHDGQRSFTTAMLDVHGSVHGKARECG